MLLDHVAGLGKLSQKTQKLWLYVKRPAEFVVKNGLAHYKMTTTNSVLHFPPLRLTVMNTKNRFEATASRFACSRIFNTRLSKRMRFA